LLLANPIVLLIAAITGAVVLLYKSFTKTEEGGNKVNKVFTVLNGIFSGFLKAIKPVADFIVDVLVKEFNRLAEMVTVVGDAFATFVGYLNKDAEKKLRDFGKAIDDNVKSSQRLADAEAALVKARREQRTIQLKYQKDAEILRQIRDDESKTIAERTAANEKLGNLLNEQLNKELQTAKLAMTVAKERQKIDGDTTTVLDEIATANEEIADINERITSQQSEQKANLNGLRRDAAAAADETKRLANEELKRLQAIADAETKAKADTINKIIALENEGEDAKLSAEEREINAVYDKYFAQIEAAKQNGLDTIALEEGQAAAIAEIRKKYSDEKATKDKEDAEILRKNQEEGLADLKKEQEAKAKIISDSLKGISSELNNLGPEGQVFGNVTSGLDDVMATFDKVGATLLDKVAAISSAIGGVIQSAIAAVSSNNKEMVENEITSINNSTNESLEVLQTQLENGSITKEEFDARSKQLEEDAAKKSQEIKKKAFDDDKKYKIASTITAGATGAVAAFAGAMQLGPIAGPIVGGTLAAAIAALTAFSVSKIEATEFQSSKPSGGGGIPAVSATIPQTTVGNQITGAQTEEISSGGIGQNQQAPPPQRVYVLESDISGAQNNVNNIARVSEYG
jgi:hypothetical protein